MTRQFEVLIDSSVDKAKYPEEFFVWLEIKWNGSGYHIIREIVNYLFRLWLLQKGPNSTYNKQSRRKETPLLHLVFWCPECGDEIKHVEYGRCPVCGQEIKPVASECDPKTPRPEGYPDILNQTKFDTMFLHDCGICKLRGQNEGKS